MTDERAPRVDAAVSIVVPVTERPENLVDLYREFSEPLRALGFSFEFLFVAEPWRRDLTDLLAPLVFAGEPIRIYLVGQTTGEAGLLKLGADRARAPIVVTLPAYRRVVASVLPDLIARVEGGADMAVARRSGSSRSCCTRHDDDDQVAVAAILRIGSAANPVAVAGPVRPAGPTRGAGVRGPRVPHADATRGRLVARRGAGRVE